MAGFGVLADFPKTRVLFRIPSRNSSLGRSRKFVSITLCEHAKVRSKGKEESWFSRVKMVLDRMASREFAYLCLPGFFPIYPPFH